MTDASAGFAALAGKQYLNLETFRRNGTGVRTPVWFAAAPADDPALYVYTTADSGKAKRIRLNGAVRVAPCDARGGVKGPWIDARAEIVGAGEFDRGMRLINRKYRPWKQIIDWVTLVSGQIRRHQRIVLAIRPAVSAT
nr:PPOX class F420-dependent oxidoreductase [uncultured Rhodopila sp.]